MPSFRSLGRGGEGCSVGLSCRFCSELSPSSTGREASVAPLGEAASYPRAWEGPACAGTSARLLVRASRAKTGLLALYSLSLSSPPAPDGVGMGAKTKQQQKKKKNATKTIGGPPAAPLPLFLLSWAPFYASHRSGRVHFCTMGNCCDCFRSDSTNDYLQSPRGEALFCGCRADNFGGIPMLNPLKTDCPVVYLLLIPGHIPNWHTRPPTATALSRTKFGADGSSIWLLLVGACCFRTRIYFMLRNIIVERAVISVSQRTTEMTRERTACRPRRRNR